ncbi:MAG: hypothetical protein HFJ29_07785 [Clostridia bacterium]|nr:hypothetical protein [Clostridia bacterium]
MSICKKLTLTKKMNKSSKNIFMLAIIALLIIGIAVAVYSHFKTEPIDANTSKNDILDDANSGLENFINDIFDENNIENEEENTQVNNTQATNGTNTSNDNKDIENQITPGEKKALEFAKSEWKKKWGNLEGVSFNNESIQSDGKYIVSVNDSKTTRVLRRYVIDTITGVVEEQ